MITHTQTLALKSNNTAGPSGSVAEVGGNELVIDLAVAAGTANQLITAAFTAANVQSVILVASSNCTLKTNSTSSPGNTFNLVAGLPLVWSRSSGYFANPFTADVTAFYLTTGAASAALQARILTS